MKILLFGTFDHLHPGHLFVFEEAQKRGNVFVVVARDANVLRIKGRAPQQTQQERMAAVQAALPGATVMLGDDSDFLAPVRRVQPDLILLGYDQKLPPGVTEADLLCRVERLPAFRPEEFKSSLLRKGDKK